MRSLYLLCMVWLFAEKHNKVWLLASDWLATPGLHPYAVQVEFRFARLVQSELCVTFPRSIEFANITTASLPSQNDIHESPDLAFSFLL